MPDATTRDFCQLTFITTGERDRVIRVPDPVDNITPAQINTGASDMINGFIFDEDEVGNLVSLKRADILRITTQPIIVA